MSDTLPLLRIPLAIASCYMAKTNSTPPHPAKAEERNKYQAKANNDSKDTLGTILWWWLPTYWSIVFLVNLVQIYDTIQTQFPALDLPPVYVHSFAPINRSRLPPIAACAFALALMGHCFRMHAVRHLGHQFTFILSLQNQHKLVTNGPYSVVRHPGYLGAITFCIGNVIFTAGPGSIWFEHRLWAHPVGALILLLWVATNFLIMTLLFWRTTDEDAALRKEFGTQWDAWAYQTPYKLVPFVY